MDGVGWGGWWVKGQRRRRRRCRRCRCHKEELFDISGTLQHTCDCHSSMLFTVPVKLYVHACSFLITLTCRCPAKTVRCWVSNSTSEGPCMHPLTTMGPWP